MLTNRAGTTATLALSLLSVACGRVDGSNEGGATPLADGSAATDVEPIAMKDAGSPPRADASAQDAGNPAQWNSSRDAALPPLPFELGEPGWRDSTEIYCWRPVARVWADSRGVFAVHVSSCDFNLFDGAGCTGDESMDVYFNDGTGWTRLSSYSHRSGDLVNVRLTGVPGGPLIIYPSITADEGGCAVGFFDPNTGLTTCYPGEPFPTDVFALSATAIYAVTTEGQLHLFDGATWSLRAEFPDVVVSVWADETARWLRGSTVASTACQLARRPSSVFPTFPREITFGFGQPGPTMSGWGTIRRGSPTGTAWTGSPIRRTSSIQATLPSTPCRVQATPSISSRSRRSESSTKTAFG